LRIFLCVVIIYMVLLTNPIAASAYDSKEDLTNDFVEANQLYSETSFKEATALYEKILDTGYESAPLYYNLGNSYFKIGSLGKSILNYERSKRLNPGDGDLISNLDFAYSLVKEPSMERTRLWVVRKIDNLLAAFSIDSLTLLSSGIYLLIMILLIVSIFTKQLKAKIFRFAGLFLVIFIAVVTIFSFNLYRLNHIRSAIIITASSDARFEPLEDTAIHFRLYEGLRVSVLKVRGNWTQVRREDGKIGWIDNESYEII